MNIQHIKHTIFFLLTITFFSSCLKDDDLNQPFQSYNPTDIGDGLSLSTPDNEQMDAEALTNIYKDVYADENLWSLRSLLVFRNGKLVSEAYLKDDNDISTKHLIWSCTKQFIGILTGIAIDKGFIADVNDPISVYFTDELSNHQDKRSITIRNLITMQSGINFNNDGVGGESDIMLRQKPDNSVEFILDLPVNAEQGTEFLYNDGNPHLMSALIQKVVGKPTDEWADDVLFSKIGMTNYNWVRYKDGITLGGFGIETTPRELGKFALCVADSGRCNGDQVISKSWIKEMTKAQIQSSVLDYSFGYFWWVDLKRGIYFMWGHGGQFAFIVPEKKLLVVMTSIPNTQANYEIGAEEALPVVDRIIQASR